MANNLPKFIGVGAQRAGTTWLYECLAEHPQVFVPQTKELHFFDHFYDKGIEYYRSFFPSTETSHAHTWGEITPNYYMEKNALERIKADVPNVKLIYILREPISRAISQYELYAQNDFKGLSFEEALNRYGTIIDLSMQGKHLTRIYELFPRESVLVLFYDELQANPGRLIKKVYSFLGVDDTFVPQSINKRINRVVLPGLQDLLRSLKLGFIIELIRRSPLAEPIKELFHKRTQDSDNRSTAKLKSIFQEDIKSIEDLLNVDLSDWK